MTGEPLNGQTEPSTADQRRPADPLVRLLAASWTLAVLAEPLERGLRYQDLLLAAILTDIDELPAGAPAPQSARPARRRQSARITPRRVVSVLEATAPQP